MDFSMEKGFRCNICRQRSLNQAKLMETPERHLVGIKGTAIEGGSLAVVVSM